ncbi:MAG: DUF3108 domain-containing protein [Deltaproteobacteria bacterium]|nr:DUF3108 domain-containing protein [Deltaproteobacteria bacterium]
MRARARHSPIPDRRGEPLAAGKSLSADRDADLQPRLRRQHGGRARPGNAPPDRLGRQARPPLPRHGAHDEVFLADLPVPRDRRPLLRAREERAAFRRREHPGPQEEAAHADPWTMAAGAQSLFSILHFLRTQKLEPSTTVSFPVSHDEKNVTFAADVVKKERVETFDRKEEREALLLKVHKSFAEGFYKNIRSEPEMWFSTDDRKRLLRFELPHRFGRVTGVLKTEKAGG